jgi:hypothetical protein
VGTEYQHEAVPAGWITLASSARRTIEETFSIIERIDSVVIDNTAFRNEQGQNLELERSNRVTINGKLISNDKAYSRIFPIP